MTITAPTSKFGAASARLLSKNTVSIDGTDFVYVAIPAEQSLVFSFAFSITALALHYRNTDVDWPWQVSLLWNEEESGTRDLGGFIGIVDGKGFDTARLISEELGRTVSFDNVSYKKMHVEELCGVSIFGGCK